MEDEIFEFDFGFFKALLNKNNSRSVFIPNEMMDRKDEFLSVNHFFETNIPAEEKESIYICVNLTSDCNMRCRYCFNAEKKNKRITAEEAIAFIEKTINANLQSSKFFIDLSGHGEPLLDIASIIEIADYAYHLQNVIGKEILVQFICNGTLLTRKNVELLQSHNIIFGISLDGIKEYHDKNRIFKDHSGSFDLIMKNYSLIEHKEFIGAGMTYCPSDFPPVYESYLFLDKYFRTFSVRICRGNIISDQEYEHLVSEYFRISSYIIDNIEGNGFSFLTKITNGDDYFGRYIIKCVCEAYVINRCDAGRARYSLGTDHHIYACSAGVNLKEMTIDTFKNEIINDKYERCASCKIEHICGGECLVNLILKKDDINLCRLKNVLFDFSLQICGILFIYYPSLYKKLTEHIEEVVSRQTGDEKLLKLYSIMKNKISFTDLKALKDKKSKEFDSLYFEYVEKNID